MTSPRLTLSDAYREQVEQNRLMLTRPARTAESTTVSVTRNAKLQYQFSVETTHTDPNVARDTAVAIAEQLEERFPADGGLPARDNGAAFDE